MPVRALAAVLLLSIAGWPPVGPPPDLGAAYPNPVYPGDTGEFVVLDVPPDATLGAYELSDGETTSRLPDTTATGTIAVAENVSAAELAGYRVVLVESLPALSNAGETIQLRRASDGTVVDTLTYATAREAELQTDAGPHPVGATSHPPRTTADASVTAFVLPDDPRPVERTLSSAEERILLAGYTLTSQRVRDALLAAAGRGVDVRVLLDGAPVGGDSPAQVEALEDLTAAGVDVRLVGGPRARYAFHHAKYAVVDDSALVLTENWKASGTGGHGNRGWGLLVHDRRFADGLARVFRSDADWRGIQSWPDVRESASRDAGTPANATYPRRFEAQRFHANGVTLAVTPDNAESVVLGFIANASTSLLVQQVRLGEGRLRRALVDAGRRGVRVELLLSGKWYVRDENRLLADCLNGYATRAGLPLTVRVVDPRSRFGKVHAKVAVADGERVLLGSLNWNQYALDRNREVIVVASGTDVAGYYGRVFRADWRGGAWRVSATTLTGSLVAVLGAGWWLRRQIEFDEAGGRRPEGPTGRSWTDDVDPETVSPVLPDGNGEKRTADQEQQEQQEQQQEEQQEQQQEEQQEQQQEESAGRARTGP